MGDLYYDVVVFFGRFPFWVSSVPKVIGVEHVPRDGAFILASTHLSPQDVSILIRHTPRRLDFVSIIEVFRKPLVGWFFGNMNAFPVDRQRHNAGPVRVMVERLGRGRVIAIFPEGRIRAQKDSVIHGGSMRPGAARLARMANVSIVPAVVIGSTAYGKLSSWLPLRRVRYGVAYGPPIKVDDEADAERQLAEAYQSLYRQIAYFLPASSSGTTAC